MSGVRFILSALCLVTFVVSARAEMPSFDQANRLYELGKYRDAINAYQALLSAGDESAALWFNLGNAQFKSGCVGDAIAAYRQAEQLAPRDSDVRANLDFARRQVTGPKLEHGWLHQQMASLSTDEWTLLAVLPVWACFALLITTQLKPAWKSRLRRWVWISGIVGLAAAGALAVVLEQRLNEHTVVVNSRDTVVRAGPFEESPSAFTAADGAEFELVDTKGDWCQISDGSKALGWLKTNSVVAVQ